MANEQIANVRPFSHFGSRNNLLLLAICNENVEFEDFTLFRLRRRRSVINFWSFTYQIKSFFEQPLPNRKNVQISKINKARCKWLSREGNKENHLKIDQRLSSTTFELLRNSAWSQTLPSVIDALRCIPLIRADEIMCWKHIWVIDVHNITCTWLALTQAANCLLSRSNNKYFKSSSRNSRGVGN